MQDVIVRMDHVLTAKENPQELTGTHWRVYLQFIGHLLSRILLATKILQLYLEKS
jgi:hypothetical protein